MRIRDAERSAEPTRSTRVRLVSPAAIFADNACQGDLSGDDIFQGHCHGQ